MIAVEFSASNTLTIEMSRCRPTPRRLRPSSAVTMAPYATMADAMSPSAIPSRTGVPSGCRCMLLKLLSDSATMARPLRLASSPADSKPPKRLIEHVTSSGRCRRSSAKSIPSLARATGREVLDDDVGLLGEQQCDVAAGGCLEVQADAALVAVHRGRI